MSDSWLKRRLPLLERSFWTALARGVLIPAGLLVGGTLGPAVQTVGVLLLLPLFVYLYLIPVWHWKARYRGAHSDLWGALMVLESTGWSKLVYWVRHVLPDHRGTGRYADPAR